MLNYDNTLKIAESAVHDFLNKHHMAYRNPFSNSVLSAIKDTIYLSTVGWYGNSEYKTAYTGGLVPDIPVRFVKEGESPYFTDHPYCITFPVKFADDKYIKKVFAVISMASLM